MKSIYYRPVQFRGLIFLGLMLLALALLGTMAWRNFHHFKMVLTYVNYSHRIQNVSIGLQQAAIEYMTETSGFSAPVALTKMLAEMALLKQDFRYLTPESKKSLETVSSLLTDVGGLEKNEKKNRLVTALKVMSKALDNESFQREKLLEDLNLDTQSELYVALVTFVLILAGALLFLKRRILHPLNDLTQLLERLSDENYSSISTDHLDSFLLPVFTSYNQLVLRLAELEDTKRRYTQSLQQEVRLATQALLEQQYNLARTERLAAIGEVAAELAHEIRNPLAGIQMAFSNLRREIADQGQCERMELINDELKRLGKLLNDILDQSKHAPEIAVDFDLATLIRDLVILTRYQIPDYLQLEVDVDASFMVHLPASGLRQALLNLILNSASAIGNRPGHIRIKAFQEKQILSILVLDTGPGFSEEMINYGIRPFCTGHHDGTGLGLAMVQRFVKDAGGSIQLTNQKPCGACVTLLLPSYATGVIA